MTTPQDPYGQQQPYQPFQPEPGYGPQPGYQMPPPPPPRRRRTARSVILSVVAVLAVLIAIGAALGGGSHPRRHHPATTAASPSPASSQTEITITPKSNPPVRTKVRVVFVVTGSAPGGADITYGSDSDNLSPHTGVLPFHASVPFHDSALYYALNAQLNGSGDITCRVYLKVTKFWMDGTHKTLRRLVAHGRASGGYNICDAQVNN
jgi:hypothetical protein